MTNDNDRGCSRLWPRHLLQLRMCEPLSQHLPSQISAINSNSLWKVWSKQTLYKREYDVINYMVNFLKFWTPFSSQIKCWLSGTTGRNSQNAVRIANSGPWSVCFWRSSLIWAYTVCLGLFGRQHILKKCCFFRAGIHKNAVRKANSEDPDQTLGLHCLSRLVW